MNQKLQNLLDAIQQSSHLSDDEIKALSKTVKEVEKEMEITSFKLDRTEKVKRTTAILLEETIEELEQKRKAIEATYHELEIESSLERVRTVAMSMMKPDNMLDVCKIISQQLELLQVKEIRNVQTAIFYKEKGTYMNYEFYAKHDKTFITETSYTNSEIHTAFAVQMMKGAGEFFSTNLNEKEVKEWIAYQKTTNVFIDDFLYNASSLNYYWYSLGPVALGISTYAPLEQNDTNLFNRFVKVFELAYRRYLDIEKAEAQAKEAQLETSLERIRAQAMAMRKPEDLTGICEVLYAELHTLGFAEIRNAMINIHDDEKETFVNYDYSDEIGKSINHLTYNIHPLIEKQIKEIRNAEGFSETSYTGKDLEDMITFRKKIGEKDDPRIEQANTLYYYFYSIGTGSIGISTFNIVAGEKLDVLKRFRNVFTLAYQRYTDIALAEAQAKEANIETALEKVRSRSLAMHKSDELNEVVSVLFERLKDLHIPFTAVGIAISIEGSKDLNAFVCGENEAGLVITNYRLPSFDNKISNDFNKVLENQLDYFVGHYSKEEKDAFYTYVLEHTPEFRQLPENIKRIIFDSPSYTVSMMAVNKATFNINDFEGKVLADDEVDIIKRFAKVFDQTYTRFLDLQKAEAQAREAQIELALERVRARTMAMHKSEELLEAAILLYSEFRSLGITQYFTCGFILVDEESHSQHVYITNFDGDVFQSFKLPLTGDPVFQLRYERWKQKDPVFYQEVGGEELKKHLAFAIPHFGSKEAEEMVATQFPDPTFFYMGNFSHGYLHIVGDSKLTAEEEALLARFTRVFEMTYKRFLDLQKAEAQAREAQIQLALERVRARTMAMQRSEELEQCAVILFQQIGELGINAWSAGFSIWEENDTYFIGYNTNPTGGIGAPFRIPLTEDVFFKTIREAKRRGEEFFVFESEGKSLVETYRYMDTLPVVGEVMRGIVSAGYELPKYQVTHCGFFPEGHLMFITLEPQPEAWDIFKRFTKVFEQTYTRFLDLQKAEAQAREAQIELALERVRARTMAMQHSDELMGAANLLFQQVQLLGISVWSCGYNIWEKGEQFCTGWMSTNDVIQPSFRIPLSGNPTFVHMKESRLKEESFYVEEVSGEALAEHYRNMFSLPDFKAIADEQLKDGLSLPTFQINHVFNFKHGNLIFIAGEPIPEAWDIFKRFTKVFEQTYTRFLDLQKAEAQAREAKIEAALERVRSRSMAMQKSEELTEVAGLLFKQVTDLGIKSWTAGFNVWSDDNNSYVDYITSPNGGFIEPYTVLTDRAEALQDISNARKSGVEFDVQYVEGEKIKQLYIALTGLGEEQFEKMRQDGNQFPSHQYEHFVFGSRVSLIFITYEPAPEAHDIFKRFGKVFEQTYTRFLDLQKAEAQTREAQINLAVERVRARALAMFKSEEILELVFKLKQEMIDLEIPNIVAATIHLKEKDGNYTMWDLTSLEYSEGKLHQPMVVHYRLEDVDPNLFIKRMWENTDPYFLVVQDEEDFKRTIQFLRDNDRTKEADESEAYLKNAGIRYAYHPTVPLNNGRMCIDLLEPPSGEIELILPKMGAAFDLAYKRFEDLKNSEAQLREAQIEAALERVRSKTMAMHNSTDVGETVATMFNQLVHLGITTNRCGILIFSETNITEVWTAKQSSSGEVNLIIGHLDVAIHPMLTACRNAWKKNEQGFTLEMKDDEVISYYTAINKYPNYPTRFNIESLPSKENFAGFFFADGAVFAFTDEFILLESSQIFKRFANVFGQTYRRYLDLQKAEAQTREAQIETALEKVRGRSLAMHHSDELNEVVNTVLEQLKILQVSVNSASIYIFRKGSKDWEQWVSSSTATYSTFFYVPYADYQIFKDLEEARQSGKEFYSKKYSKKDKNEWFDHACKHSNYSQIPTPRKKFIRDSKCIILSFALGKNTSLQIAKYTDDSFSDQENEIIKRFSKVFEQSYTRFLDLQKAETQAREAQIETALEKVRSRTMAMQSSNELQETAAVLFREFKKLGTDDMLQVTIGIYNEDERVIDFRVTNWAGGGEQENRSFEVDMDEPTLAKPAIAAWKARKKSAIFDLTGDALQGWLDYRNKISGITINPQDTGGRRVISAAYFSKGHLTISTPTPLDDQTIKILERFAAVFDGTYTRFLDLQKAEAQAREAQIETALERVRSRTMAMYNSTELIATAELLYDQINQLGAESLGVAFGICEPDNDMVKKWTNIGIFSIPYTFESGEEKMYEAWKNHAEMYEEVYEGEKIKKYYETFMSFPAFREGFQKKLDNGYPLPVWQKNHAAIFKYGYLLFITTKPFEETNIFIRFAKVFEQTYTRFLDLQKAEAQTREAQIETCLERVRSRSLAMHHTTELQEVIHTVHKELLNLNIAISGGSFIVINNDIETTLRCWGSGGTANTSEEVVLPLYEKPFCTNLINGIKKGQVFFTEAFTQEEKIEFFTFLFKNEPWSKLDAKQQQETLSSPGGYTRSCAVSMHTSIFIINHFGKIFSEDENDILKRFAKVFEQTYTRFLDLKNAEAREVIAVREASLDRVRGEIASMRTAEDLQRITPLVWRELTALGVPFFRCGLFIVDEPAEVIHFYLSTPDGKPLAALELPFQGINVTKEAIANWRLQKVYTTHWSKEEFIAFANNLLDQGQIKNTSTYLGGSEAPESLTLQFVPFKQGMLYVGSENVLNELQIDSVKALANAFSTAYARYEDFIKLESAKQQIEKTLEELKTTQKQLIQSEKMASLGELTAGIAHEIQNPLNFVNNFSEVSTELVDEMNEEIAKGNLEDAKQIAEDLKQNLQKINHHGKRAGDIVKGMLQHSRNTSNTTKEPTDINKLADEYLRLAYHGLRAKDKSFNATMKTDFDESLSADEAGIGNINIIPQDIGRVILNLITNAFYVVNEKKKSGIEGYEPTVSLSTKKENNKVLITVKDNGNGIPQKILDKIFQPFFTTKPTGQGTGLGLSLSYDIVKAHGGELKVETKPARAGTDREGEGSEFIIQLPV